MMQSEGGVTDQLLLTKSRWPYRLPSLLSSGTGATKPNHPLHLTAGDGCGAEVTRVSARRR